MAVEHDRIVADAIVHNGTILTINPRAPVAEALAIVGDRIAAIGRDADMKRLGGAGTPVMYLRGVTASPGLIDNHTHQLLAGLDAEAVGAKVNIAFSQSIAEIKEKIAERVKQAKPGEWIGTSCMFR